MVFLHNYFSDHHGNLYCTFEMKGISHLKMNPGNFIFQVKNIYFPVLFFVSPSGRMEFEMMFTVSSDFLL